MEKLDLILQKLDSMEHRMDSMEHRMDSMERKMDSMKHRMDSMEHKVDSLETRMNDEFFKLNLRLENEVFFGIKAVADGHADIMRRYKNIIDLESPRYQL